MRDRSWIIGNPSLTRYGRVARYPPAIPEESVELNLQLGLKQCWEFRRTQHLCAGLSIGLTFHRVVRLTLISHSLAEEERSLFELGVAS